MFAYVARQYLSEMSWNLTLDSVAIGKLILKFMALLLIEITGQIKKDNNLLLIDNEITLNMALEYTV